MPSIKLNRTLKEESLRPGSSWTKFNNFKMRSKKFAAMSRKIPLDVDAVNLLGTYCINDDPQAVDRLRAYGLESGVSVLWVRDPQLPAHM